MERRKLTKEDIDKVRGIEGFPLGTDEDIIALSDAPYYTACPNPFIEEFIKEYGTPYDEKTDDYHREPFAADVSEGKNDPIYGMHNYHTKVPPKAILRYLLHYTKPKDIVLDGFCGSGMTGVAAQLCGSLNQQDQYRMQLEVEKAEMGFRYVVLNDLSPAATFISYNQNTDVDANWYSNEANNFLQNCEKRYNWMYETEHVNKDAQQIISTGKKGIINYTVWSDVFVCPVCGEQIIFTEVMKNKGSLKDSFICSSCGAELKKAGCERAKEVVWDDLLGKSVETAKQVPVLINYTYLGEKYEKRPDENDLKLIEKIAKMKIDHEIPLTPLPEGYNTEQPRKSHGVNYMHQFYTKRNLIVISVLFDMLRNYDVPNNHVLRFTFEQVLMGMAKIARYVPSHYSQVNQYLSGTLYIASQVVEVTPRYILENKIKNLSKAYNTIKGDNRKFIISTGSTTDLPIPESTIDYIFTDPPFGANLNYSELSFLWEAWYKVLTNNNPEAIMNSVQEKGLVEYQELMTRCFKEYYRVLKPNRWMTVEFHNSKGSVWNAIQEALLRAGFIIADVRTLDKKQGSFKQVVSDKAVKQDLVISVYKPRNDFVREFAQCAGTEESVWSFIGQHLAQLPVVVDADKNGKIDVLVERQAFLLYDRMIAYHIMQGVAVPLDAMDFYKGLNDHFIERDNMYFLPNQINEYDLARATADVEEVQLAYLVTDEKSAIQWLYNELKEAQTYQIIMPKFMQAMQALDKHEKMPELADILEENFLKDDEGKWYIPDITKSGDIAKLREKNLLKEFQEYLESKGKLKVFRSEAVRAGFAKLWKDKDYKSIVSVAERLPEKIIQEDPNLLMYYDISLSRV